MAARAKSCTCNIEKVLTDSGGLLAASSDTADGRAVVVPHGKTLALYFSASWCRPCAAFTPLLQEFYSEHRDKIEVVFMPVRKSDPAYQKTMPWLVTARPEDSVDTLMDALGVKTIPALVLVNPADPFDFRTDGRDLVMRKETRFW